MFGAKRVLSGSTSMSPTFSLARMAPPVSLISHRSGLFINVHACPLGTYQHTLVPCVVASDHVRAASPLPTSVTPLHRTCHLSILLTMPHWRQSSSGRSHGGDWFARRHSHALLARRPHASPHRARASHSCHGAWHMTQGRDHHTPPRRCQAWLGEVETCE